MTEKNKGGRPPKYNSPEELGLMIDGYWASLELWNSEEASNCHRIGYSCGFDAHRLIRILR